MKIKEIIRQIEKIAPPNLAQSWDNTGLLIGDSNASVKKILLTIDITKEVVREAKRTGCNFIISYHPVIWDGLKTVAKDSVVFELVKSGISVYSIHTALDAALGGVNDGLAEIVGIKNPQPVGDFVQTGQNNYKLVIFVPVKSLQKVANAVFKAGAGAIGNYSHCSFSSAGLGTFFPLEGAKPTIGKKGKLEKVDEIKFESIVPAQKITDVVKAMKAAHPYEMPAFDVIKLYETGDKIGLGRIGLLGKPVQLSLLLKKIKSATGAKAAGIVGPKKRLVKKAAVCAGSCGKLIMNVIAEKCDLYLTGEIKHHQAIAAQEAGVTVVCLSHTVSERFILKKVAKELQKSLKDVKILVSKKDKDPFEWMKV
ncbi:MAG: Nif3-like dinuclear metal center hexameric protein [Planctomycetes bacterium]|nr:Nif3-like dinuclear metal center hexameric protein [Planctomycetota bacterium]MBU1517431.1 Nif3-like dinuclear metal center hexameric protein [Planctomycetota bacterium]MBU2457654.1 Nif3-like dinuclear metal center hexameric protein [Planctomycetota bacterium]